MEKNPWFTRHREMGKHTKGPMEYQPNTWQGCLILIVHVILTFTLIYIDFTYIKNWLFDFLTLVIGGGFIYGSYNFIASLNIKNK